MKGEITEEEYKERKATYIETILELYIKGILTKEQMEEKLNQQSTMSQLKYQVKKAAVLPPFLLCINYSFTVKVNISSTKYGASKSSSSYTDNLNSMFSTSSIPSSSKSDVENEISSIDFFPP